MFSIKRCNAVFTIALLSAFSCLSYADCITPDKEVETINNKLSNDCNEKYINDANWKKPFFPELDTAQKEPLLSTSAPILDSVKENKQDIRNIPAVEKPLNKQVSRVGLMSAEARQLGSDSLNNSIFSFPENDISTKKSNPNVTAPSGGVTNELINNDISDWCLTEGGSLRATVIGWGKTSGWNVKWNSEYDYPISATFCLNSSFSNAISSLTDNYATADRPLYLDLYPAQSVAVFSTK